MKATNLLSSLPDNWQAVPIKTVCYYTVSNVDKHSLEDENPVRLCNYTDVYKNDRVSPELELMRATATEDEIEKFHLEVGDVIITKDSESWNDIGIPAYVEATADDFVCGYHLAFMRPNIDLLDGRFLFRCVQSRPVALQLELEATGVTRYGLPKGAIGNALIPLPPLTTQRLIADYLDRETARIDALVEEKEIMLALLEEKRAALISRAVTRGLNPDAPLKPSGLDWMGDIPAHWELRRGKCLFIQSALPVQEDDEIVTCFRNGTVTLRKNRREDGYTNAVLELGYQGIEVGQLVLHSMDAFAGAIGISDSNGKCSPEYIICNPISEEIVNNYYGILLRVMALRGYILAACTAVRERAPRIRFSHLATMFLPLPPKNEQKKIVLFLQNARSNTEEIEQALVKSIGLLKERRAALITAAVTGQIDLEQMQIMSGGRHEN